MPIRSLSHRRGAAARSRAAAAVPDGYWTLPEDELLHRLDAGRNGLAQSEAEARLRRYGPNETRAQPRLTRLSVLLSQLRSPLLWLLLFAAAASAVSDAWQDAAIVLAIVVASAGIGYQREYRAQAAAAALARRVTTHARVLRDGRSVPLPFAGVVPGDVVLLAAGSLVPADAVVLEATDCFVSQSVLTGESYPVEKRAGAVSAAAPLAARSNCVYQGTNVRSGTARCVVVATDAATEFGTIAQRLSLRPPETAFERGVRHFGYLLTSAMLVMVLLVFVVHVLGGRPPVETLLFAIALAVGLSPELLPAILNINLARGATMMAARGVLVRRLDAIENLGSIDILCTDKTGTLTEGVVRVEGAYDADGGAADAVLELAALNAALATGLENPLDDALLQACKPALDGIDKRAEIPFDFVRKRAGVVVAGRGGIRLITKGAVVQVLDACSRLADGRPLDDPARARIEQRCAAWNEQGIRVLAVAQRELAPAQAYGRDDEHDLTLAGFVTFLDRPKDGAAEALAALSQLGVAVKIITGDSRRVAEHVAGLVGLPVRRVLDGRELGELKDEALWREAERTDLFVEVDPNQKERIILALRKMGHVVGFLGDGVNDAPAMHAADTSLSVDTAVDVAREAADFVLLEHHLDVIRGGIEEGRRTFANTLKYVLTTMSANLGNMLSMAVASLLLPFLPLLAGQILLNNFLSDIPAIGLADDSVDPELTAQPQRWDMGFIARFMVEFGLLSSLFDLLTFAVLLWTFHASPELFRSAWFTGSLLTELLIALVVRTRRPLHRSRPGSLLAVSTAVLVAVALLLPYLPVASALGFVPLPLGVLATLVAIALLYVGAAELTKRWFYRV